MWFFSRAFFVFLRKESKKRRRKQPGKLMAKSRSQPVNLPGAQPLNEPPALFLFDSVMYLHAETSIFKDKNGRTT